MNQPAELDEHTRPLSEAVQVPVLDTARELLPGQRVGQFKLIRSLGAGGMGQVWLAEQQEPLVRQVALKLQKQRLSGGIAEAYFQVERQVLAQLVHPYIGQIYDAGTLPDGALYFAMEFVDGLTLDRFVARKRLDLDTTVQLLIRICQGVQHAHQRGLIHRDLKPGNILVLDVSGQPIPKIIDFGVAIGVDPRSGVAQTQRRAGTRAYMAPEQQLPGAEGIDVRADVFALGTLLAECVCSVLGITLDLVGSERMRSLLVGVQSDPGSEPGPGVPHKQQAPPVRLAARRIPVELRAIALKAMALDRAERYESAAALADDLERWRQSRPVRAMSQGRWYAVRCFIRRYRLATAAGVLVFVALVAGLITAWYGLQEAVAARALAEARREKAEKLIGYMLGDFSDKLRQLGKLELLDGVSAEAMRYLGENTGDGTGAFYRARAMRTLGEVQSQRGQNAEAAQIFAEAEKVLATSKNEVPEAELLLEQGNLAFWRGNIEYQARNLDSAEKHWRDYEAYAARLVPLTADTGTGLLEASYTHDNLGTLAFERKQLDAAIENFQKSIAEKEAYLKIAPGDTSALEGLSNSYSWLGRLFDSQSKLDAAFTLYRKQTEISDRVSEIRAGDAAAKLGQAYARLWTALGALDLGQTDIALDNLGQALPLVESLVQFDPSQVEWQDLRLSVHSELLWTRFLLGTQPASDEWSVLRQVVTERLALDPQSRRLQRLLVRVGLRQAVIQADPAKRRQQMEQMQRSLPAAVRDSEETEDVRLRRLLDLELLAATRGPERVQVVLTAGEPTAELQATQVHFRDLDLAGRWYAVQGDEAGLALVNERLAEMAYAHPDYQRFQQMFMEK